MKLFRKIFLPAVMASVLVMCGCVEQGTEFSANGYGTSASEDIKAAAENDPVLFDNSAIVRAYKTGNREGLTQLETDVLNKAASVLDELKANAATPLKLELAVHDYIVEWATYDPKAIEAFGTPQENSENPYGILIERRGICYGYSTTFQLFMDMADIPCITVIGHDDENDDHSWNEVQIDGKWYYVDCTWDDPVPDREGRAAGHTYFNVTEKTMKRLGHVWDTEKCYPANSFDASYENAVK